MKEIVFYTTKNGKSPFLQWQKKLKDPFTLARIDKRLREAAAGYYGDYKMLGNGLLELRLTFGKGYRVYFAECDDVILVILNGGTKNTKKEQSRDIEAARAYLEDFLTREVEND